MLRDKSGDYVHLRNLKKACPTDEKKRKYYKVTDERMQELLDAEALLAEVTAERDALGVKLSSSEKLQGHLSKLACERWGRVTELGTHVAALQGSHRAAEDALAKLTEARATVERLKGERDAARKLADEWCDKFTATVEKAMAAVKDEPDELERSREALREAHRYFRNRTGNEEVQLAEIVGAALGADPGRGEGQ